MFCEQREKPLILMGDDNRLMRAIISDLLKREGYDVIGAENGEEVLSLFEQHSPDIVLLDVVMPIKDGLTTCRELRASERGKYTPVLMITALEDNASIEKVFSCGSDDYIPKPIKEIVLKHRIRRVLETERYRKKIEHYASYDLLTAVLNRRAFVKRLIEEISRAKREKDSIGIILADIDRFKIINDTYGHNAGDAILRTFARLLKQNCPEYNFIGRYGGDEFILCIPNAELEEVEEVAKRLQQNICQTEIDFGEKKIHVTASFGINVLNNFEAYRHLSYEEIVNVLIGLTDKALYSAKQGGRNRVC